MVFGSNVIIMSLHYSPFEYPVDIPVAVPSSKILCQAVKFVTVLVRLFKVECFVSLCCHLYAITHLILSILDLYEYFIYFYVAL